MPIRFRCESCQAKIRVPEGSEGRKVKCPRCGLIQSVPERVHASEPVTEEVKLAVGAESASLPSMVADVVEQSPVPPPAPSSEAVTPETHAQSEQAPAITHLRLVRLPEPEPAEPEPPQVHQTASQPEPVVAQATPVVEGYPSEEPSLFAQTPPAEEPEAPPQVVETSSQAEELQAVTAALSEPAASMTNQQEGESSNEEEADEPAAAYSVSASDAAPVDEEQARAAEVAAQEVAAAQRLAEAVKTVRATATKVRALPMDGSARVEHGPAPAVAAHAEVPAPQAPAEELPEMTSEPSRHRSRRAQARALMAQIAALAVRPGRRESADELASPVQIPAAVAPSESRDAVAAEEQDAPTESPAIESDMQEQEQEWEREEQIADHPESWLDRVSRVLGAWRNVGRELPAAGGYFLMGTLIWFFRGATMLYAGATLRAVVEAYRHGYSIGGILDVSLGGVVRVLMILSLAEALRAMRQVAINTHGGKVITTPAPAPGSDPGIAPGSDPGSVTGESHRHAAMRPKLVAMRSDRNIAPGSAYRRMRQAALR